jgi:pyruvate/2-oxoglutarate dehydrogenase complex dihydrolipoamide acyltransferase (E2) component
MESFLIEVPMPSMGATVNELTVVTLKTAPGAQVVKGQKVAELESDKSIFEFESPCDGTVRAILAGAGEVLASGAPFLRIETTDTSLKHLEARKTEDGGQKTVKIPGSDSTPGAGPPSSVLRPPIWTPRALKLAQEAGLDPATVTDIEATGPGGRVSGDDVARLLARRKG